MSFNLALAADRKRLCPLKSPLSREVEVLLGRSYQTLDVTVRL